MLKFLLRCSKVISEIVVEEMHYKVNHGLLNTLWVNVKYVRKSTAVFCQLFRCYSKICGESLKWKKCHYGKTVILFEKINFFGCPFFRKFWPQIIQHVIYRAPFHGSLSKKTHVFILEYFSFASVGNFFRSF